MLLIYAQSDACVAERRGETPEMISIRAAVVLAGVLAGGLLAGCSGGASSGNVSTGTTGVYGTVPVSTGTAHAGVVTVAQLSSVAPTWIFPVVPGANSTTYNDAMFNWEMYRPLYFISNGYSPTETPSMSLAADPVYSDGDTSVTVTLKGTYKWSDGQPVTSRDILFWYDEMQAALRESPANWTGYTPGLGIPDEVASISTPSTMSFVLHLKKAVNPSFFTLDVLGSLEPIPAHAWAKSSAHGKLLDFTNPANAKAIYDFLAAQSKDLSTYTTSPLWRVVDGPYQLSAYNPTTGSYELTPNTRYDGPHAKLMSAIDVEGFASETAAFSAVKAGSVDIAQLPFQDIPRLASLRSSYYIFGAPGFGFDYISPNFKDATGDFDKIIAQFYIRQALQHLVDQQGYIDAFMYGAGVQSYSAVPSFPESPYQPADARTNPYPYSPSTTIALLKEHGWKVAPGGTDTCVRPGTAADECGAGIPAGTALAWNLISYTGLNLIQEEDTDFVSQAAKVGIKITMSSSTFDYIIANYNDASGTSNENKWAMDDWGGQINSAYPSTIGLFNTTGSGNNEGYSDPEANSLINASVVSPDPLAVRNELAYLAKQLPVIYQPENDTVWAVSKKLSGTANSFASLTQSQMTGEYWYFTK
jgi:peptide/nickel transport system substrate-binding protein